MKAHTCKPRLDISFHLSSPKSRKRSQTMSFAIVVRLIILASFLAIHNSCCLLSANIDQYTLEAYIANNIDPGGTAPLGAVIK